ncbi:DinB family protein [Ferruginibacter paludis]|uniref:DinB family protein n=1 Tax=Ferruginibacter paludis TaxID=1310417 RepID=UPI0025B34278|nr:DinB family protein [Ferruginibacter paludis]MDN3657913.1 DinB family protein [Ferruginibacter paludis]
MSDQQVLIIQMILDSWNQQISKTANLINSLTDEQLMQGVAPGRNRGIYLFGHLIAVHDRMLPLLNLSEQLYPELNGPFLDKPDRAVATIPTVATLRAQWKTVHAALAIHFESMRPEGWLLKHNAVSEEAFAKEPHRNRLNVILNRTNHLSYHYGQLAFLKK